MRIVVRGHDLPGRTCGSYRNVHVGLQVGDRPDGLVPGDAPSAEWQTEVEVTERDGAVDYRGPAVRGRRGERFVYLTWGEVDGEAFAMFRRAKLMLGDLDQSARDAGTVVARVRLTDGSGMPLCARVRAPAVEWSVAG